ncbi:MAG: phosphotransferase [Anaerolineaceae bacterium]|nr:phosphotransferase [Anaerolineaceae bacterium]
MGDPFARLLETNEAMNEINKNLDKPIAYGRTAEIYAWGNEQVLKLFHDWYGFENIKNERRIAQVVHASGLPVPSVGEIIHIKGQTGLIFQRAEGFTMEEMISRKLWRVFHYAKWMADLHAEMHANTPRADIPDQHQRLIKKINHAEPLSDDLRSRILAALESMPEGSGLCHGDFHPGNIIIGGKDAIIIDWVDVSLGNPLADLARTTILVIEAIETNKIQNPLTKLFTRGFHNSYIHRYFSLRPGGEEEYSRWLPIVAAARLSENIPESVKWLITQAEKVTPTQ